jgi:hypothetical protein
MGGIETRKDVRDEGLWEEVGKGKKISRRWGKESSYQANFFFALAYRSAALGTLACGIGLWP